MSSTQEFTLPVNGWGNGTRQFHYNIAGDFFESFEQDQITSPATFDVELTFDKSDDMFVLDFDVSGHFSTDCDRCATTIQLPIEGKHQLIIKLKDDEFLQADSDEFIFLSKAITVLDIKEYVYEAVMLSIPMTKTYACDEEDPAPCDFDILDKLYPEDPDDKAPGPWDDLLKIKDRLG